MKIAGYTMERISIGNHTVGKIDIDKGITVLFRLSAGGGGGWPDADCATCIVTNISSCRDQRCPDDPDNCYELINECIKERCQGKCKNDYTEGGGVLILV